MEDVLQKDKPLYVFSSHFHEDHFTRAIFEWKKLKSNVTYILSKDILRHRRASSKNSWAHINYLQVDNFIFVPQLGIMTDKLAVNQISKVFPTSKIVPVDVKGIVNKGGALNCVSWNHYEE